MGDCCGRLGQWYAPFFEFALCYLRLVPIRRPALSALNTSKQRHGEANPHGRQYSDERKDKSSESE